MGVCGRSTPYPTPYTLHPTPHTLHLTPYTLHPALSTLNVKLQTPNPRKGIGKAKYQVVDEKGARQKPLVLLD